MEPSKTFNNIQTILGFMFDREEAQLSKREKALVDRHIRLEGNKDGFRYLGLIYSHLQGRTRKQGKYSPLNPELVPELELILSERKVIADDKDSIRQALYLVLRDTVTYQDIRDALPNCLHQLIPECRNLPRTREEAFTIRGNERAFSQYIKIRDKIELYVAARLLY